MSPRGRMLAGFLIANGLIFTIAAVALYLRPTAPPHIQGVILPEAHEIKPFQLLDQNGETFTNEDLRGEWHLVTYGFTTCPDICPTTLAEITTFKEGLARKDKESPQVLFYSVDHQRDTPQQLASYLPFFDPSYIGLTHRDNPDNPHLPFEQSLGIISELIPSGDADSSDYQVSHGVTLFLLNPEGELQAIFEPSSQAGGLPYFEPERLGKDYLAVRKYFSG